MHRGNGDDKVYPMPNSQRRPSKEVTSEMINRRRLSEVSSLATIQSGVCRINPVTKTGQRLYMVRNIFYILDSDMLFRSTCYSFLSYPSLPSYYRMPPHLATFLPTR